MTALAIVLLVGLGVASMALAYRLRVWQPTHVVLIRELDQRLQRERARHEPARRRRMPRALVRLREVRDLERTLVIAGRPADVARWLLTMLVWIGLTGMGVIVINLVALLLGGDVVVPWPFGALLPLVGAPAAGYLGLYREARRVREGLGRAMTDMLGLFAVMAAGQTVAAPMRDPSRIEPGDWISRYALWRRDTALLSILEGNRWQLLTPRRPTSPAEWFQIVENEYGVTEARVVARVLRLQRERGPAVAEEYLREARRMTKQRLSDRRVRSRRNRIIHTVASVGLLGAFFTLLSFVVSSVTL